MNAIPPLLDHLILATPDLAGTVADFAERTGVTPAAGGVHAERGTRNFLVGLGGRSYLEILGEIDGLAEPRTLTWAVSPPDLDAAVASARARGYDPGAVRGMSRRRPDGTLLEWRLTDGGGAHPSGLVPFLIDWGASVHPTESGLPVTPLVSVSATAPDPDELRPLLAVLGTELALVKGPVGMSFTVDTPRGPVTFG